MPSKCTFKPYVAPGHPEVEYEGYSLTPTWVVVKDNAPADRGLTWIMYHVPTGYFATFHRTKRHAEWMALALGETLPFTNLRKRMDWARAQWELEDARKALERAEKKRAKDAS